jgi:hypothetical protein
MKKNTLALPLSLTAALTSVIALNLGCGKKTSPGSEHWDTPQAGTNFPTVSTDLNSATNQTAAGSLAMNGASTPGEITTPPAAATTQPPAPATPEIAPTAPAETSASSTYKKTGHKKKIVEMPATAPAVPARFYSGDFATNHYCLGTDYEVAVRAGYLHTGYGDNHDTAYGGVKFYAHPDQLRAAAGKNAWLIPDFDAELTHQYLAKPDDTAHPGTGEGLQLRADIYWPWVNWTLHTLAEENAVCPFSGPLHFGLGPVFITGFDKTFDGSGFRFARYGGARLTLNRYAFVQYAYGETDGFAHDRQEVLAELPFYVSHDGCVRYVLCGEWSRGELDLPDYYAAGAFVEMPLDLLIRPREWRDLVPFTN